jgi:hypothetical protein
VTRVLGSFAVAATLAVAVGGSIAAPVFAQPGPIALVSTNGVEQADFAGSPALAADGRFVAFAGRIGGLRGIFRKDLASGEIAPVAIGEASVEPSISANGRYVSFTTTKPLDPEDDPVANSSDVYVADMATTPPTYELASALDGCDPLDPESHAACGLSYESSFAGSLATGRLSLSADGREVVFVTKSASNLTEPAVTAPPFPTPPLQVAVRDLETDETILISGALDPLTGVPLPDTGVEGGAVIQAGGQRLAAAASLSADGSTVAWLAQHPAKQVAIDGAEGASISQLEAGGETYDEPLVRRVPGAADPTPPTRRIVSGSAFPEVVSGANVTAAPCLNATGWNLGGGQAVPVLSADGSRVALIGQPNGYADAFLADLAGPTPVVRRLTASPPLPGNNACEATQSGFLVGNAEIKTIAIAPDGERIAFTTRRQRFALAPPNLVTPVAVGVGTEELYLVDLAASSLERLTHGTAAVTEPSLVEQPGQAGASAVSFDRSGVTLAFSSQAYNLVPADGNGAGNGQLFLGEGTDVFLVSDPRSTQAPGTTRISAPPPAIRPRGRWALTAHASSLPDGAVRVAVGVPGAGNLGAVARTQPARGNQVRKVAAARRKARLASVLVFLLHPTRGVRSQVRAKGGLEATLRLHFAGKGGAPLVATLDVRFRLAPGGKKKGGSK